MIRRRPVLIGTILVALGTVLLGWFAPMGWGVIAGLFWAADRPARKAAMASASAWALLLLLHLVAGYPVVRLAGRLAGALGIPSPALVILTLLFPAVLSGCAAYVVATLVRSRRTPAPDARDPGVIARRAA
jgi:hypothetical protein